MNDIVERLKSQREVCEHGSQRAKCPYCEVAELEAEIERLRAALREIRDEIIYGGGDMIEEPDIDKLHDIARAALEGRDE